jgi:hypothetical protein
MGFERFVSKKLGVVSAALFVLYKLAEKPSEVTRQLSWQIMVVVLVYMLIQGVLDYKKGDKS